MNIRFATKDDLSAIVAIYNEAVGEGYANADIAPVSIESRQQWFEEHEADSYPIYIFGEEEVMGWCSLSPYRCGRLALRHTVEISYYVAAEHRRRGVASKLISHAIEDAARLDLRTYFGILMETNKISVRLLEGFGFQQWGFLPDVAELDGQEIGHIYMGKRVG